MASESIAHSAKPFGLEEKLLNICICKLLIQWGFVILKKFPYKAMFTLYC